MLNETQKKVLVLTSQGKKPREIAEKARIKEKSLGDVLKRARSNLDQSIESIEFAIENHLLNNEQILLLKNLLESL